MHKVSVIKIIMISLALPLRFPVIIINYEKIINLTFSLNVTANGKIFMKKSSGKKNSKKNTKSKTKTYQKRKSTFKKLKAKIDASFINTSFKEETDDIEDDNNKRLVVSLFPEQNNPLEKQYSGSKTKQAEDSIFDSSIAGFLLNKTIEQVKFYRKLSVFNSSLKLYFNYFNEYAKDRGGNSRDKNDLKTKVLGFKKFVYEYIDFLKKEDTGNNLVINNTLKPLNGITEKLKVHNNDYTALIVELSMFEYIVDVVAVEVKKLDWLEDRLESLYDSKRELDAEYNQEKTATEDSPSEVESFEDQLKKIRISMKKERISDSEIKSKDVVVGHIRRRRINQSKEQTPLGENDFNTDNSFFGDVLKELKDRGEFEKKYVEYSTLLQSYFAFFNLYLDNTYDSFRSQIDIKKKLSYFRKLLAGIIRFLRENKEKMTEQECEELIDALIKLQNQSKKKKKKMELVVNELINLEDEISDSIDEWLNDAIKDEDKFLKKLFEVYGLVYEARINSGAMYFEVNTGLIDEYKDLWREGYFIEIEDSLNSMENELTVELYQKRKNLIEEMKMITNKIDSKIVTLEEFESENKSKILEIKHLDKSRFNSKEKFTEAYEEELDAQYYSYLENKIDKIEFALIDRIMTFINSEH